MQRTDDKLGGVNARGGHWFSSFDLGGDFEIELKRGCRLRVGFVEAMWRSRNPVKKDSPQVFPAELVNCSTGDDQRLGLEVMERFENFRNISGTTPHWSFHRDNRD